jgi:hypothetical protein
MKRTLSLLTALRLIGILGLTALTGGLTNTAKAAEHGNASTDSIDARRELVLKNTLANRELGDNQTMKKIIPLALACYWLNQDTAAADKAILRVATPDSPGVLGSKFGDDDEANEGRYILDNYLLQRVYFLFNSRSKYFPGRMSKAAEDAVAKSMWNWASEVIKKKMVDPDHIWWLASSENLAGRQWASYWGAAQILADHPDYRDRRYADGTPVQEMARAFDDYYKLFTRERATKGLMIEVNSAYNDWTLNAWYNIADVSRDPVTRRSMRMFLDVWWADWAIEQIDGVRGGSRYRCYPGVNSQIGKGAADKSAWYVFGIGQPPKALSTQDVGPATTFWRPAPIVTELLPAPQRGTYDYYSRRPGLGISNYQGKEAKAAKPADAYDRHMLAPDGGNLLRYTFSTPDCVMGTSMVPALPLDDWTRISSQNRWEGVIFAGHATARIFVQPNAADGKHQYNASWSVQNKGVMIVQRLETSKGAKGQRIWFDATLKHVERDGWVFAEAPHAYAAVRVVDGGNHWEADKPKHGSPAKGMWLKCENEFSPVILEVVCKSDYPDFAAFQWATLENTLTWKERNLDYRSGFYKTQLTFFADYSKPPQVNGVTVNYNPPKVYNSPFIQGDFGSGVVTIRKDDRKIVLHFNE